MAPFTTLADRLLRVLVPQADANAAACTGDLICYVDTCELYCCIERGCYRWGWCCSPS